MGEYNINFGKFAKGLLPQALRGTTLLAFIEVLVRPFREIHTDFTLYREEKLWYLNYNCTAASLQEMLNDYFHESLSSGGFDPYPDNPANAPIQVVDGVEGNEVLVYQAASHLPVKLNPVVRLTLGITWGARPFIVRIPAQMHDPDNDYSIDEGKVRRVVNIFKLYGIGYSIEWYT